MSYPLLLLAVGLASVVAPLNSTMIFVALPDIRTDFGVGHGQIAWLVSAYLIAMAVAQPVGGRLGDQIGPSRMVRIGLATVVVCSLGAALAPNFALLVLFRTGQAMAAAAMVPNGIAMLRAAAPPDRLGEAGGITGSAPALSAALGPLVGAALMLLGSWRWLFVANLPVVLLSLAALLALSYRDTARGGPPRIDVVGTLSLAGVLAGFTYLVSAGSDSALQFAAGAGVLAGSGLLLLWTQLKTASPVAEWTLLRSSAYAAPTAYVLLSYMVMYTLVAAVPFVVEEMQGRGSHVTGLLISSMAAIMALTSPVGGWLSDRRGRRLPVAAGGAAVLAAALLLTSLIAADTPVVVLAAALALLGAGMGLSLGPSLIAAVEAAPRDRAGAAAGTTSMMRYAGSSLGAAMLGGILGMSAGDPEADSFRLLFAALAAMALMAVAVTFGIAREAARRPEPARAESVP